MKEIVKLHVTSKSDISNLLDTYKPPHVILITCENQILGTIANNIYYDCYTCYTTDDIFTVLNEINETCEFIIFEDMNSTSNYVKEFLHKSHIISLSDNNSLVHELITDVKPHLGKPIKVHNNYGILLGLSKTLEDYYLFYLDTNLSLHFFTCLAAYENTTEIPNEFLDIVNQTSDGHQLNEHGTHLSNELINKHFNRDDIYEIKLIDINNLCEHKKI